MLFFFTYKARISSALSLLFSSSNFNQNIGSWDVSNVTNTRFMFSNSFSFNAAKVTATSINDEKTSQPQTTDTKGRLNYGLTLEIWT